ncbi:carbonic anhydrase [Globomyces pollinis-pini]|nr:carbonic anhydrase [Globomyces pollinis-pini]
MRFLQTTVKSSMSMAGRSVSCFNSNMPRSMKLHNTANVNAVLASKKDIVNSSLTGMVDTKFANGHLRFKNKYFSENKELFESLKNSQAPKSILIGCSDSRVDPAIITDCDPGDFFVVRNVANLVAPYELDAGYHGTASALEYAVRALNVENIVVMGHSKCGGIAGLMSGATGDFDFVGPWVSIAQRAKDKTLKAFADQPVEVQNRACEEASILCSLENLTTYPWVMSRLKENKLTLSGWYFDFENGTLSAYNQASNKFESVAEIDEETHSQFKCNSGCKDAHHNHAQFLPIYKQCTCPSMIIMRYLSPSVSLRTIQVVSDYYQILLAHVALPSRIPKTNFKY